MIPTSTRRHAHLCPGPGPGRPGPGAPERKESGVRFAVEQKSSLTIGTMVS
jgi:hypothetical protein